MESSRTWTTIVASRSWPRVLSVVVLLAFITVLPRPVAAAQSSALAAPESAAAAPVQGAEEDLGQPIPGRFLSPDQAQGVDQDGRPQVYWVANGNSELPAMFQVTDVRSGEVVFKQRLPEGGVFCWGSTFSTAEGAVYFGMDEGQLYRWTPGDESVTYVGTPFPGEWIFELAAADDGTIYGGTFPGGLLFSFDPESGEFTNYGQVNPGETYVRSIVVDENYVYVGSQPHAKLARFDRQTGETVPIPLPDEYADDLVVYDMTLAGPYLFVRVAGADDDLLVLDRADGSVVNIVEEFSPRAISGLDPSGNYVYFRINTGAIVEYDINTHTYTVIGSLPNALPISWAWVDMDDPAFPGLSLVMSYYFGRIYVTNLETGATKYIGEEDLEGTPNPIQEIGTGPDGKIYVGFFLSPPGMVQFDPSDGSTTLLPGAGQVEGFGSYGPNLVWGRYPTGQLMSFDTRRPWELGVNPGPSVVMGSEQDRPQAFVKLGRRIAVGSVPASGRLGGALSIWDPATDEVEVHRNVVPDQSVVSLASRNGLIFGGTSIWGGAGAEPVATEAVLFAFDPATSEVVERTVPVPGAHSVNALTFDQKGTLWGLADGYLFTVDVETMEVTRSEQLFPVSRATYGTSRGLAFHRGHLYAVSSGSLWRVDPRSWAVTELAGNGVVDLAQDEAGNLYYARVAALYRWNFAATP